MASVRPFQLMVDSGAWDEPPTRYFGTLERAVEEMQKYEEKWQRHAWIIELREEGNVTRVRDGRPVERFSVRYVARRVNNPQQWVVIDTKTHETIPCGSGPAGHDRAERLALEKNAVPVED